LLVLKGFVLFFDVFILAHMLLCLNKQVFENFFLGVILRWRVCMTTVQSQLDESAHDQELFIYISVYLTGFERVELEGTGLVEEYFRTICQETSNETRRYFFDELDSMVLQAQGQEEKMLALIASNLMPTSSYQGLAKNIIYMWYTGQWAPTVNNPDANLQQVRNISGNAYQQGLMWLAAQTHPPGAKQPGYGSWAHMPLQD
jgi:hypothetical protein